ncbi:hypothetical protein E2320_003274 [Naja naja]|nr:hypothetical protein E2320_003274 [Naja naja]
MSNAVLSEQEKILQEFHAERVFLSRNKEWLVEKNLFVKSTVERIVKWAYESSTGLYPFDPIPVGSYKEGLHLQVENTSNDFDFLIPIRYNSKLALRSRIVPNNSSSRPTHQLPTYIFHNKGMRNFPDKGLPVFCQGTKMLVDIEDVAETDVKIYCDKLKTALGEEEEEEDDPEYCKLEMCQESLSHHNLDPEQILKDFHQYSTPILDKTTILLWSCEIYPRREAWETLLSSLKTLLGLLKHTLVEKCLPHYFLKPLNLFNKHYKTSNDIYWPLSLEALTHEVSAMLADATAYLVLSHKSPDYLANQGYEEKTAALQEFKERHWEELEELKGMEDEHMYEEAFSELLTKGQTLDVISVAMKFTLREGKEGTEKGQSDFKSIYIGVPIMAHENQHSSFG